MLHKFTCIYKTIACLLCLGLQLGLISVSISAAASSDLPAASLKVPPMVKEVSVSTYVPSDSAPGQGLAVNLIYSHKARYKESAPVVVLVPGGNASQGLDFSMHSAQQGFVEVRFAFPGGGKPGFVSSGIYDNRGSKSQEALRDVLRFASGQISDHQNRKISDLLPFKVDSKAIGAVGWSNGGNILLVTLAKYASDLSAVSFLAFYESPVGNMFFPCALGGAHDMLANKHYRQGTAATGQVLVDYKKLCYQYNASKSPGAHKKNDEAEIDGVIFFDDNSNGFWEESTEFAVPYSTDIGMDKQIYPPSVTKAIWALPGFQPPQRNPKDKDKPKIEWKAPPIATYEESLAYFRDRDGSLYIKQVVQEHPQMAFCIFGSQLDHLQRQSDHPHVAMLYNSLLEHKARFLRLNPSSIYVGAVAYMKPSTFPENRPNSSIDAEAITKYLEPEGLIPDYAYMEAAVAELADRVHTGKWQKVIEAPLVNYSNGALPPELLSKPAKPAGSEAKGKAVLDKPEGKTEKAGDSQQSKAENPGEKTGGSKAGKDPSPVSSPAEKSKPKDWPFRK